MIGPREVAVWVYLLGQCVLVPTSLAAQSKAGQAGAGQGVSMNLPSVPNSTPTLHVYADLIQVPVLVMGPGWVPIPRIANDRFRVSIGGGPLYRVQHVRLEGEDPIALGILLDLRGSQDDLLKTMGKALAGLVPGSLHAQDRVSLYGLDCGLLRSMGDVPATQQGLRHGVKVLLNARRAQREARPRQACPTEQRFWDALGSVVLDMSRLPGRRVVLAVSNGYDKGSQNRANRVREYAQAKGVAIFGLADVAVGVQWREEIEAPFDNLCQLSGGMITPANSFNLSKQLEGFVKMVRGRYILEFPRPSNATPGGYSLDVRIDHSDAWIRSAGAAYPIEDSAVKNDPTTVNADPSLTPVQGTHRVLDKP